MHLNKASISEQQRKERFESGYISDLYRRLLTSLNASEVLMRLPKNLEVEITGLDGKPISERTPEEAEAARKTARGINEENLWKQNLKPKVTSKEACDMILQEILEDVAPIREKYGNIKGWKGEDVVSFYCCSLIAKDIGYSLAAAGFSSAAAGLINSQPSLSQKEFAQIEELLRDAETYYSEWSEKRRTGDGSMGSNIMKNVEQTLADLNRKRAIQDALRKKEDPLQS